MIVFATPLYYYGMTARLKTVVDRTCSFMDFTQPDFSMAGRKDKKLGRYFFAGFGPASCRA
ncbi:MAG: NAD(P)H-dependent oxidoreductase [Lachnospiraceae bacterium]|nr:NAD(P)H-dependent oxidoreductase [Lachnospiraceae bacterium]